MKNDYDEIDILIEFERDEDFDFAPSEDDTIGDTLYKIGQCLANMTIEEYCDFFYVGKWEDEHDDEHEEI